MINAVAADRARSDFRRHATQQLIKFTQARLPQAMEPERLAKLVEGHDLVVSFILPLEYGGTLHRRNMMLTTPDLAKSYRTHLNQQYEQATAQKKATDSQISINILPSLIGKKDDALFLLPLSGDQELSLPLRDGTSLELSRKPQGNKKHKTITVKMPKISTRGLLHAERRNTKKKLRNISLEDRVF